MDNNFFNKIFYDSNLELYKNKKISTYGWQGDTISCFIKKYRTKNHSEFKQEKKMLTILKDIKKNDSSINWFPELYWDNNEDILVLEHVGQSLNHLNIPKDYKEQINKIFYDFNKLNLYHSDLCFSLFQQNYFFKTECTILNQRLYITDFGQAFFNRTLSVEKNEQAEKNMLNIFNFIYESKTIPELEIIEDYNCFGVVFHNTFKKSNIKVILTDENDNVLSYKASWDKNTNTFCIENVGLSRRLYVAIYYLYNNINHKIFQKELKYKI